MSFLGAVLGAVGSVGASIASGLFGKSQADKDRSFQEQMSGTSYQRAVKDMRAAGLNPMLAANLGGASTPHGAHASAQFDNPLMAAVTAKQMAAQANLAEKQAKYWDALSRIEDIDANRKEKIDRSLKSMTGEVFDLPPGKLGDTLGAYMSTVAEPSVKAIDKVKEVGGKVATTAKDAASKVSGWLSGGKVVTTAKDAAQKASVSVKESKADIPLDKFTHTIWLGLSKSEKERYVRKYGFEALNKQIHGD